MILLRRIPCSREVLCPPIYDLVPRRALEIPPSTRSAGTQSDRPMSPTNPRRPPLATRGRPYMSQYLRHNHPSSSQVRNILCPQCVPSNFWRACLAPCIQSNLFILVGVTGFEPATPTSRRLWVLLKGALMLRVWGVSRARPDQSRPCGPSFTAMVEFERRSITMLYY